MPYLHTFNENENAIDLCVWSKDVKKICTAEASNHYPLEDAGIWADSVRLRKPVIHNDYAGLDATQRHGMPDDHFPVYRHMSFPVFSRSRIVSISGVGNKSEPYTQEDADNVMTLSELLWSILEQRRAETVIEKYAFEDGLTGISNRRKFNAVIDDEWNRHRRLKSPLALVMFDIDFFKLLNDRLGHVQGDISLQQVADILRSAFRRSGEMVFRYGGEEFMVVMPHTGIEEAFQRADFARKLIQDASISNPGSLLSGFLTVSAGVASTTPEGPDLVDFVKDVDALLYKAKQNGRNNCQFEL